jgi:uncharacterized protein (UPF0332 family)
MNEDVRTLVRYRLEQAQDALEEARILLAQHRPRGAMNRVYYAMFYAVVALLASRGLASRKHTGVISLFHQQFVKPGLFPADLAGYVDDAFDQRNESDYVDFAVMAESEVADLLANADRFVDRAREILAISD